MIENDYYWRNILLLAIGTLAIRSSIIAISAHIQISPRWREIFSFFPAAIFPAFFVPAAFFHEGHFPLVFGKERLVVLGLAAAICYYSRSTLATICFGLFALYFLG